MTQTKEPTTTPSVSLDLLRTRSAELAKGIDGLQKNIAASQQQLHRFREDLTATSGAKQFVDQIIAEEDKKIADAVVVPFEAPKAE